MQVVHVDDLTSRYPIQYVLQHQLGWFTHSAALQDGVGVHKRIAFLSYSITTHHLIMSWLAPFRGRSFIYVVLYSFTDRWRGVERGNVASIHYIIYMLYNNRKMVWEKVDSSRIGRCPIDYIVLGSIFDHGNACYLDIAHYKHSL